MTPKTQYVQCGDLHIAYQVVGEGTMDLVYVPGWVSHIELAWEEPALARFLARLASFSRLITFDKRGTGLSDRVAPGDLPTLEERMDDLRCVLEAVGSREAALFGFSEGGNMCMLYAATYPSKTRALVIFGSFVKRIWSPDYPWAPKLEDREKEYEHVVREWGNEMDVANYVPSKMHDKEFINRLTTYFRRAASPQAAVTLLRMNTQVDIREILPTIQVPTLVMHRTDDIDVNIEEARLIARMIPNAKFVEFPGADHLPWVGDQDVVLDEVQEFLTGARPQRDFDRVLTNILFTDIVGSTELASKIGDRPWKQLLERHNNIVRECIYEFRGEEIDKAGDGFLVTFEGPLKGLKCAKSIIEKCEEIGLQIRAGIHLGEVHKVGKEMSGISVHVASRIRDMAGAGQILVSRAVRDLVGGSWVGFVSLGKQTLRGVPGEWEIFESS